jgi:oxygen-independent coproporphyrinogen-3 oxidase
MTTPLSIYLHIPFCRHRCAYCDFNTYTSLDDLKGRYALALAEEAAQVAGLDLHNGTQRTARTLFFGGGTPSLMDPADMRVILERVSDCFTVEPEAEITMEANPGTVDRAYLEAVRALGVNRLSFGVQSAIASELAFLEREHDFAAAVDAVAQARAAGFDNLNLDLIYGVPGQSLRSWEESVRAALDLRPEHISLYCLTIEQGTPMSRRLARGDFEPPDPDLAADQYQLACAQMGERGYEHYEISNWALSGYECRHNLTYWRNEEYLGLGAGAHGHAGGYRYSVIRQPRTYIRRMAEGRAGHFPLSAAVAECRRLTTPEAMSDTVITQLRLLVEGLDLVAFAARFGVDFLEFYRPTVEQLVEWELLEVQDQRLRLTERGWFLSNQVFYRFL